MTRFAGLPFAGLHLHRRAWSSSGSVLRYTVYGRSLFAIGASPSAARLAGIRTKRVVFIAFLLSSLCVALAGLIRLSQVGGASVNGGLGIELSVVTAVVLGGASLSGGRGGIVGTVAGGAHRRASWPTASSSSTSRRSGSRSRVACCCSAPSASTGCASA